MTDIPKCGCCGRPQDFVGVQKNVIRGVEHDLFHCGNPDCKGFEWTASYNPRRMKRCELIRKRAALEQRLAEARHG